MAETLSVAKNQILALKANQAESPDQPGNTTELSAGNISETVTNIEVTNSAVPLLQLLHTLLCQIAPVLKLIKNSMQCCMVSLNVRRVQRNMQDLTNVISAVSHVDHEITICDCLSLGKYKESAKRPRPILVKLTRAIDVISLLSNRSSLPKNISIKPDMSQAERTIESLLMKERWRLIQTGIDRKSIKIQAANIYVNNKLHGKVCISSFTLSSELSSTNNNSTLPNTSEVTSQLASATPQPTSLHPSSSEDHATKQSLKVFYMNTRSIVNKFTKLYSLIYSKHYDIIAITET